MTFSATYGTIKIVMLIHVERTQEFSEWFDGLNLKDQLQIDSRIQRIRDHLHFGDAKNLGEGLAELRWKNGTSIFLKNRIHHCVTYKRRT